ncbi:hypothetical protein [Nocardia rhizosphaerihabitans]|uniref:HTH luxR-type domain-containing protein n=1 Tax=Nocardia rhizosphaerihabitans TaxID=1691570 RepID=A0ABQ2K7B3_9NOCA|nr:hypothetical protein [Nocardia rhizosphaerihabitans]GGN72021.1 hypothetical protein GCM10011610_12940 [Nocardia rhizosphaerihabitans]
MIDPNGVLENSSDVVQLLMKSRKLLDSAIATQIGEFSERHGVVRLFPDEKWAGILQQMLQDVREEAVVAVCAPLQTKRYYQHEALVLRDLLEAGRRVRVLYSQKYANSRVPVPGSLCTMITPHTKVTRIEFPNTIIVDRRVAVLWSGADSSRPDALMVREPSLLHALHQFATTTWDSATRLDIGEEHSSPEFDAVEVAVLEALGIGLKDEVAARRLSVSLRTYRRYVAAIMVQLGVGTRYQLGVRAAELGFRSN